MSNYDPVTGRGITARQLIYSTMQSFVQNKASREQYFEKLDYLVEHGSLRNRRCAAVVLGRIKNLGIERPDGNQQERKMNMTQLKELAKQKGKRIVFNRGLGGYQVVGGGFNSSEIEIPFRDEKNKPVLAQSQIRKLASYV